MGMWAAARRPGSQDVGLAIVLLAGTALMLAGAQGGQAAGVTPVLDGSLAEAWPRIRWLLIGVAAAAVAVRRRRPFPALVAATLATLARMAAADAPVVADVAIPILLYTVAAQRRRAVSLTVLGGLLATAVGWSAYVALDGKTDGWAFQRTVASGGQGRDLEATDGSPGDARQAGAPAPDNDSVRGENHTVLGPTDWGGIVLLGPLLVGEWAIGWGMRSRRAYLGELVARARDLERERDQQAALAVAAERARITRELHDVVAHGLAVIVMQAQGGAAAFEKRPSDTLAALDTIVATGRASLADMRQVLSATGPVDGTQPVPGLARLPQLVEQVRQAGTSVQLHIEGVPRPLPAGVDVSAYRIVQEALTNTMKHGGPGACAQVVVAYRRGELRIDARDNGVGGTPDDMSRSGPPGAMSVGWAVPGGWVLGEGTGNGLRGMRERVALLGGEVEVGPGPGGGYVVSARIPLERLEIT
ncbi:sensor histidine kinase [Actinoplanes sp. HUAS TT8]|uniref:sensor histidine kinase n=1 Tax=Actinoplanes sp. HUAS TT8 TaxID=3447453 RepID=UPI003F520467